MWSNSQFNSQFSLVSGTHPGRAPDTEALAEAAPASVSEPDAVSNVQVLRANPGEALADAVKACIFRHEEPARRTATALDMSYLLRRAMSIHSAHMDPLPIQLGQDYDRSRNYLIKEAIRWVRGEDLNVLLNTVGLPAKPASAVKEVLTTTIPFETVAVWMCREFGHLRATRHAIHSRRYVAARLTSHILGETGRSAPTGRLSADAAQARFDVWVDPVCDVETSLHYRSVVQPVCNRLVEIGAAATPDLETLRAANTNEASS